MEDCYQLHYPDIKTIVYIYIVIGCSPVSLHLGSRRKLTLQGIKKIVEAGINNRIRDPHVPKGLGWQHRRQA